MNIINTIVLNESPEEVILFLTKSQTGISYPRLDRLYNMNSWAHVTDNLGLLELLRKMCDKGLIKDSGFGVTRGPNWREPTFMTEKKYILD